MVWPESYIYIYIYMRERDHFTHELRFDHVIVREARFSFKVYITNMIWWNMRQAYLLEVAFMQVPAYHGILFIVCHVSIHVVSSSMIISLGSEAFTF